MGWNLGSIFSGRREQGERFTKSGLQYHWHYIPPAKNTPARAELSIPMEVDYTLSFEREHFGRWLAKALGFAREFQTGDESFDKKVYITSDDPQIGDKLQADIELRETMKSLFEFGIEAIKLHKGRLRISMVKTASRLNLLNHGMGSGTSPDVAILKLSALLPVSSMLNDDQAEDLVQALNLLKRKLTVISNTMYGEMSHMPNYQARARMFNILSISLFIVGLALFVFDRAARPQIVNFWEFFLHTLPYAGAVVIVVFALLFLLLGRSSTGYVAFMNFLLMGVIGTVLCTSEALYTVNMWFDKSEATQHRQFVTGTHTSRSSKGGTRYYIDINGWNPGQGKYSVKVNYSRYQATTAGMRANVYTHAGYLGYEWVERYELLR